MKNIVAVAKDRQVLRGNLSQTLEAAPKPLSRVPRDATGNSPVQQQSAQRYHERLQTHLCNQQSVNQSDEHGQSENSDDGPNNWPFVMREQIRQENAHQAYERTDRQVDATSDDDERGADAEDAIQRGPMNQMLNVADHQKLIAGSSRVRTNCHKQAEDAPNLCALLAKEP